MEQCCSEKGFAVASEIQDGSQPQIPAKSSIDLRIGWRPKKAGTVRETLHLRWEGHGILQAVLHGTALESMQAAKPSAAKQAAPNFRPQIAGAQHSAPEPRIQYVTPDKACTRFNPVGYAITCVPTAK